MHAYTHKTSPPTILNMFPGYFVNNFDTLATGSEVRLLAFCIFKFNIHISTLTLFSFNILKQDTGFA
jgi:hypothetical protein